MTLLQYIPVRICLALSIVFGGTAVVYAAPPEIRDVNIRGLQIGKTTTIIVDGADLLPEPKLVATLPIAKQAIRPNPRANRVEFDVTVDAKATPGFYNLWLATRNGVSERIVIAVDHLSQLPFATEVKTLPAALHGRVNGSSRLRTSFNGKKGQQLVFEVEAQRLGSKLRPVLHLYDAKGRELGWAMSSRSLHGDTRLQATLPADGKYTLELHDLLYAAPAPNYFRLKIGHWQYADLVYPIAVQKGKTAQLEMIGNGQAGTRVAVTATGPFRFLAAPWLHGASSSGMQPGVTVSRYPEVVEAPAGKTPQTLPAIPCGINGRLAQPGEQDRFQLAVKPGEKLRFEVFADRVGSPLDAVLELQNDKGGRLASSDDATDTTDPRIDYTVPANMSKITLVVRDVNNRGGRRCIYRITVTRQEATATADFDLKLERGRISVQGKSRFVLKVTADRHGYNGPIALSFDGLPGGVQVAGNSIPADANAALITLTGESAAVAQSVVTVRGTSAGVKPALNRVAIDTTHPSADLQPWLGSEVAVGLSAPSSIGFAVDWGKLSADTKLVLGGKLNLPVKCTRPVGFDGPVRLTLITSQVTPLVNGRPNVNATIRPESPTVEIPADKKAQQAFDTRVAAEKALAAAKAAEKAAKNEPARKQAAANVKTAMTKLAIAEKAALAAANATKNQSDVRLLVPGELPAANYQVALRAELLSRDKRTVLATHVTPVRPFAVLSPLGVAVSGTSPILAQLDAKAGATVELSGKIERKAGFKADVTVSVDGLPPGIAVPRVTVKAAQQDYKLQLRYPANFKPGDVTGITVFATGRADNRSPVVRGNSAPVMIRVIAPKKTPKPNKKKAK